MKLTVTSSPHIRSNLHTNRIMLDVVIALLPALTVGTFVHGIRALLIAALSVFCAAGFEWMWSVLTKTRNTVPDCSALVTGLLLAMTLPISVSLWLVVLGNFFAIIVMKEIFGGLGQNIFNPALAARAFMLLIAPMEMTRYFGLDGTTSATPLHHMVIPSIPEESMLDMFVGICPGSIGETSSLALILGGLYLIHRKVLSPRIPLAYLSTMAILSLIFFKTDNAALWMVYSLLSGGLMLAAFFMATDYSTSPVTPKGQIVYGVGCGVLTLLFRYYGLYPEGVTYAILLMNACVWVIDRHTGFHRFGVKKGGIVK